MIWVGWRQQRVETALAAAALVLVAAVAVPLGLHAASAYAHEGLAACVGPAQSPDCGPSVASFLSRFGEISILFTWSTLLPPIAALLLAAPFVLDLENGTYRLAWTQSISRRRWLATKLGLALGGTVLVAVLLTVLTTWTRSPIDQLNGRMGANAFDGEGLAPLAYALFVLGVALALGVLWRRTVPALLTAFVVYVVGRAVMDSWGQAHLLSPVRHTWAVGGPSGGPTLDRDLVLDQFPSDRLGHRLGDLGQLCVHSGTTLRCATQIPRGFLTAVYQPAGRFWELQGIEFALVGGIGIVLLALAGRWAVRRTA